MSGLTHRKLRRHRQSGVAAVEFGLVFAVLFLFLYGIFTYGAVLYTQQTVTRSAADGARAVLALSSSSSALQADVQRAVYESLASSLVFPDSGASRSARLQWLAAAPVVVTVSAAGSGSGAGDARITVSYPYSANPLLPRVPPFSNWIPDTLVGRAVVARGP